MAEMVMVSKEELTDLQDQLNVLRLKVHNLERNDKQRATEHEELKASFWRDRQDVWAYLSDAMKEVKKCKTSKQ